MTTLDILIFSSYYWPETAGNAPYVTGVAEHYAERGHRVRVVTGFPHYPEWSSDAVKAFGATETRNGVELRRRWHYVPQTQSAITRGAYELSLLSLGSTALPRSRPDVILGVSPTLAATTLARAAATVYRRPYGLVFQDLQGPGAAQSGVAGGARIARLVKRRELGGALHATAVGIIADGFRPYFVDNGVDPDRIHRLRNWSQDQQPTLGVAEARALLGWAEGDFVCLHAGNMGHKQGLENVVEAAALLEGSGVRIVLAGNGNARRSLEELVARLRLDHVSFVDSQPAGTYESMLRAADVLLVNQRASVGAMSLASKLTSYFTAARPVVGALAAQSETARELERSGAGRLVSPEDPRALADAILWMRAHAADANELGAAGAAYAEAWLSLPSVMRSYDAFLDAVAEKLPHTRRIPARVESERRSAAIVEPPAVTLAPATDQVTLSCVIVTYESCLALAECLRSLAVEREAVELEVIVVDNASRDGTVAMVEADFPWVRLLASSANEGFASATNRGLRVATGRNVLLLNPDTIVPPGALAAVLAELQRDPATGMLGCKLVRPDGAFDHACKRGLPTVSGALYYLIGLQRLFPRSPRFAAYTVGWLDEDSPGYVDAVNGAFMLARREAIEQVGGLDERFWLYGEDLDWCLRFERAGWRIRYWPAVSVVHLKGASAGGRRSVRAIVAFHRSMLLYYEKHLAPAQPGVVDLLVRIAVWGRCGVVAAHSAAYRAAARPHGRPARSARQGIEAP